jgi:hypothetical protein
MGRRFAPLELNEVELTELTSLASVLSPVMLMLLVEEKRLHGMSPNCGGQTETGAATQINEIGG